MYRRSVWFRARRLPVVIVTTAKKVIIIPRVHGSVPPAGRAESDRTIAIRTPIFVGPTMMAVTPTGARA